MHVIPNPHDQPDNRSVAIRFSEQEARVLEAVCEFLIKKLNDSPIFQPEGNTPPTPRLIQATDDLLATLSNLWIILTDTSDIHLADDSL